MFTATSSGARFAALQRVEFAISGSTATIARLLAPPFPTVARALNRLGRAGCETLIQSCSALRTGTAQRSDSHRRPGPLLQGWSPHHRQPASGQLGWRWIRPGHVADDVTRFDYVEVIPDGHQGIAIGFLSRALTRFNGLGVECRRVMRTSRPTSPRPCQL